MVVVLIITVLAVVALPGIAQRLAGRQARTAADAVASLYRGARLRAMGRGSAILVNYGAGTYRVREAIVGASPVHVDCNPLPSTSCTTTNWADGAATNQLLETFDSTANGQLTSVVELPGSSAEETYLDVCFTPLGRALFRTSASGAWTPLTGVPRARIRKTGGVGIERQVLILPNGVARVVGE